ncbi:MAG TPA: AAA family ATPase [Burkholderiaceae bacterium]|nr:AAA family ATPase [Burkholderiaceae bacterium]
MATAADTGSQLQVRLLGELELRRDSGSALALPPSRRTRALLGYLVATGTPHLRSALCDLLWEGSDDPRAALRWSLTKLRTVVDDAVVTRLQADRDKVAFAASACDIDSLSVGALLQRQPIARLSLDELEHAARSLQGEFLDGLELPACYRFHHWWMAERERFARWRRGVLEALTARLADDPQRALPYGRAMVATDPLADVAHASLVRLLAAVGRYPEAEQHYAYARELLRREIALPDGSALDDAIHAVRRAQKQAATSPRAPTVPVEPQVPSIADLAQRAKPSRLSLIGRDSESAAIDTAIAAPQEAPVLLVLGEPGIGKTRLLDHLTERAAAQGMRVIRARCFEAEAVRPYGFWIDALRGVPTGDADEQVRAAIAPLIGGQISAVSREQLFDAAAGLFNRLAASQPLVIAVDDLQWIDDASAALLHFVARQLAEPPRPVVFAAAARPDEVDDNPGARALLQSLARERIVQRLELQPLSEEDVRCWLGDRLTDVRAAMRDSGGNPLFLIELARAAERGISRGGRALDALIDDRLHALDEASRDVLGWAAVFGGEFGAERLADAMALPLNDALARIQLLERRGLVRSSGSGDLDFAHDLVRQAVYRSLSMARRRAQHRQIARTLAAASADNPWLHGEVVHHASLAGDSPMAARAALAAGEHWLRVFANHDAAQIAERGLALLDELAHGADRTRLELGLLRLRVAAAAAPGGRRLPDLTTRIRRAIDAAQSLGLHGAASSGWEILAYWCQQTGDAAGAQDATLAAERSASLADAITRCQQLANTGRCLIDIEADGERARGLLSDAAALAAELQLPLMELEWGRGLASRADGDLVTARESLERAVALARAAANHWREYECMLALATVEFELGRYDDLLGHVDQVADAARRMGESHVPFADALAALARQRLGEPSARAAVIASLAALRERDDKAHLSYALNEAAALALHAGDRTEATRLATEALGAAITVRRPSQIARARATIAAAAPAGIVDT